MVPNRQRTADLAAASLRTGAALLVGGREPEPVAESLTVGTEVAGVDRVDRVGQLVDGAHVAVEGVGDVEDGVALALADGLRAEHLDVGQDEFGGVARGRLHLVEDAAARLVDDEVVTQRVVATAVAYDLVSVARDPGVVSEAEVAAL